MLVAACYWERAFVYFSGNLSLYAVDALFLVRVHSFPVGRRGKSYAFLPKRLRYLFCYLFNIAIVHKVLGEIWRKKVKTKTLFKNCTDS